MGVRLWKGRVILYEGVVGYYLGREGFSAATL